MTFNGKHVNVPTRRADYGPGHPFTGAVIVSTYARATAIKDGFLVDVTGPAKAEGFRFPVAMTRTAFNAVVPDEEHRAYPILSELLHLCVTLIRIKRPEDRLPFQFTTPKPGKVRGKPNVVRLYLHLGPGDRGDPVVTILLEGED